MGLESESHSHDSRLGDRVSRLGRPEELESEEEIPWSGGRGSDVWKMIVAAIKGDLKTIRRLAEKDARLVNCSQSENRRAGRHAGSR